jgi:cytochrome c biogenesis protein CcmG/thiol:disulfide interchange protein DsbE
MRRYRALLAAAALIALAVGTGLVYRALHVSQRPATPPLAAIVDGIPVTQAAFLRQLRIAERTYTGPTVVAGSATASTLHRLQVDHAVAQAIAEAVIEHTASARKINATGAMVALQVARTRQAAGGAAGFAAQMRQAGMTLADVEAEARLTVLRDQLGVALGDTAWLDHMVNSATIIYFVGDGDLPPDQVPAIELGHPAPPFVADDLQGHAVSLALYTGRPIVLAFWAINDRFSQADLQLLTGYARTHRHVVVVALDGQDAIGDVARFAARHDLSGLKIWSDLSGEAAASYTVSGPPVTFFIDGKGVLRSYNFGPLADGTSLAQQAEHAVDGTNNTVG